MIVDFTIENFRSIQNEQLLSLYAEKNPEHHSGNIAKHGSIGVLKTCAIYGPNASGKSNILKALEALKKIVVESEGWREGDAIPCYDPFLLSSETKDSPTNFSIEFYVDGKRYRYSISYDKYNILDERLEYYPKDNNRPANLFHRDSPNDWENVNPGKKYFKGGKKKIAFFGNNSYLSKLGNDAASPQIARDIYNFFRNKIDIIDTNTVLGIINWFMDERLRASAENFIRKIDIGIQGFRIEKDEDLLNHFVKLGQLNNESIDIDLIKKVANKSYFYHQTQEGDVIDFDSSRESTGTNRIFMALPHLLLVLKKGKTVLIDELEYSYHPHIAELIVNIFNDPDLNVNNAQLIFTTHNMNLMSQEFMRKDQVYLTDKINSETVICSLDDFDSTSLKNNSPFSKWYNDGRLGAVPKLSYSDIASSIKELVNNAKA